MKITTPLALVALAFAAAGVKADDLFSEIAVESVFGVKKSTTATVAPTTASNRITGAAQLAKLLRDAGFKPERVDGKAVRVPVQHGGRTLPATLRADVDRGEIEVTLETGGKIDPKKLSSSQVLSLLTTSETTGGVHFVYDPDSKQLRLRRRVAAREVNATRMATLLTEMAESALSQAGTSTPTSPPQKSAQTASDTSPSLQGSWIATLGRSEAFALRLAGGQFALVHVRAGRTTKSTGRLEQTGSQLRLVGGSGVTITGTVSGATTQSFQFTLPSGRKLSFKKS